jgi:PDZ domain
MILNKRFIPLILAAGFISSSAFAQSAKTNTAEQEAARAEIKQLTQRIQELAKKLGPDSGVQIHIIDGNGDGKTVERHVIRQGGPDAGPRWSTAETGGKQIELRRTGAPRVGLGIVMAPHSTAGVKLAAVSPNSAAQNAGLKAGDIITAINGKKLSGKEAAGLEQARAALGTPKLGETVKIGYTRAGKAGSVSVKAANIAPEMIISRDTRGAPRAPQNFTFATRWNGLHMADMNEQLGRYFGVSNGVLVLSPKSEFAALQAGDVLTKIDGKPVNTSRDVMAALRGKAEGSKFEAEVLRERKNQKLTLTAPKTRAFNLPPMPPPPPAPPAPPAPPKKGSVVPPAPPAPPAPPRVAFFSSDDSFTALELSTDGIITQDFESGMLEIEGEDIQIITVSE